MQNLTRDIIEKTLNITGKENLVLARQFVERFFNELKEGEKQIPTYVDHVIDPSLAMTVHKLAGACAYFGATALHTVLLEAERSAKAGDIAKLAVQLKQIHELLKEVISKEQEVLNALA
jgi:HPt (histidine-containing phosphotransfer) domain-containing protein